MKLTMNDKKELLKIGYIESDFKQIENACKRCKITTGAQDKRITHKDFIKNWGRKNFIHYLARATFHYSSCFMPIGANKFFIFDCYKLFNINNELKTLENDYKKRFATLEKNYKNDGLITFEEFLRCCETLNKSYIAEKNLIIGVLKNAQ